MTEELPTQEVEAEEVIEVEESIDNETVNTEEVETEEAEDSQDDTEEQKEQARKAYEARQHKKAEKQILKEENEHLRRQIEALQSHSEPQRQQPQKPQQYNTGKPNLDDFDSVDEFLEARDNYRDNVKFQQSKEEEIQRNFNEQMAQYSAKHPDFLDSVESSNLVMTPALAQLIRRSDNAPRVLHEIITDDKLAKKLNSLDIISMTREVVKLENKGEIKKPAFSNAPKPIGKSTGSSVAPKIDISEMSGAQYREYMNKQKYKG